MQAQINVKDVAREALRGLVLRKLEPTPDNYRRLFHEIAGLPPPQEGPGPEEMLADLASQFPRDTGEVLRIAKGLERALAKKDWAQYKAALMEGANTLAAMRTSTEAWSGALLQLVQGLDLTHRGLTRARKKDRIERMLEMPSKDPEQLFQKISVMVKSWHETPVDGTTAIEPVDVPVAEATGTSAMRRDASIALAVALAQDDTATVCELVAQVMDMGIVPLLGHDAELARQAEAIAVSAREARTGPAVARLRDDVRAFLLQVELAGANSIDVQQGLLRLLRLVVENAAELTADDQWLHGQITALHDIVSRPLDLVMIEHAERSLREAIQRQGALRDRLTEAKTALKSMVSGFIERLGEFSASTGDYSEKMGDYALKVEQASSITELGELVADITRDTRAVQMQAERSRDETLETRRQVEAAERRISELQAELARVSEKVREDQLTGALNRRGLEQEYERAVAMAEQRGQPLSLALLDIDNFKSLNDNYGHQAGDSALVHLARVIKDTVRPSDVVCRYGGEEFVIMLPGAGLDDGIQIMSRVQRELTKRFFLHDNKRLLITFSAGVALRGKNESRDDLIARADAAMYTAKRTGKNRVIAAPTQAEGAARPD